MTMEQQHFYVTAPLSYGIAVGAVCPCFVGASLPYMSICARVVIAVTFQEVDHAPYTESCAQCNHKYLQSVNS